jgi:hypothetical protein
MVKDKVVLTVKIEYNKPRNLVAKDLRTPKYRMRVVDSKVSFERTPKHKKDIYEY